MRKRYLSNIIFDDLKDKMVFIGGARQVGKTTLAEYISTHYYKSPEYLNWDYRNDRKNILNSNFNGNDDIIIFDEIHKYSGWKNYLKGEYDKNKNKYKIIVTGSARLDVYRKGGDSLLGRYHYHRLHPFSVAEFADKKNIIEPFKEIINHGDGSRDHELLLLLMKFGGFPEPLLKQDDKTLRRWHNERIDRLIRDDIRDIENIHDLSKIQILTDILPSKVSSLLSLNSLREDLQVTHKTIASWVEMLERFYYHFRIYPYTDRRIKSLKKEPKLYLYDWSEITDESKKIENMTASHLLKLCHFLHDTEGYKTELYFLRDIEGKEVDFLVTENNKPWFSVEVKSSAKEISKNLLYFNRKLGIPFSYQLTLDKNIDKIQENVRTVSLDKFLGNLI